MRIDLQRFEQFVDGFLLLALLPQVHPLVEYGFSILAEISGHALKHDVLSVGFDDIRDLSRLQLQRYRGPRRIELAGVEIAQKAALASCALVDRIGAGKFEERSSRLKLLPDGRCFFAVVQNNHTEKQMLGSHRGSPCRIMRRYFDFLLDRDANPVLRYDKRAACLVLHMTVGTAFDPIHRAQTGMIRDCGAVAS
jgi:hypothetical protein